MMRFSERNRILAIATFGFLLLALATLSLSCAQLKEEITKVKGKITGRPQMKKHVTKGANFVVYMPKGWNCKESVQWGFRTLVVTDPTGKYKAVMSCGRNPNGDDLLALTKFFVKEMGEQFPDLRLRNSMISGDRNRIVFDGFYTDSQKGKREFRCWVSSREGNFTYSRIESPEGQLKAKKQLLLTILSNVRVIKGAFDYKGPPPIKESLVSYHLSDGSATFKIPQDWTVQELGSAQFVASDPSGSFSFIVTSVDVITPGLGVSVPGVPVSPCLSPHEALKFLATEQGMATDIQFVEINEREDLEQQMSQVYTLGTVTVEDFIYTCQTKTGRSKGYTLGITFDSRLGTNWNFRHLSVAAPEDKFDSYASNFITMLQSYQIDEEWVRNYIAKGMARLRQLQRETSELVSRNSQQIHDMMQAAYDERQRSQDYIDYKRTSYIRGEQDWISEAEGGTVYHTDSWGTKNTATGEFWEGQPYNYVNFTGKSPKYDEQMTPIDSRELWERHIR